MSLDIVDDLQAAEDYAETLRVACLQLLDTILFNDADPWQPTPQFAVAVANLDFAAAHRFERPGCEEVEGGCIQGEDCGGYHPWVLE